MTGRSTRVARWVKSRRRTLIACAALLFTGMVVAAGALSLGRGDPVLFAYVASAGNNHVQIIDLSSGRTLRKIYAGATPWRLIVAPDRRSLWVQHWYSGTTVVVNLENHEVRGAFASRGPGVFTASGGEFLSFDWPASTLRRFDPKNLELIGEEATEVRQVYDVAPDPDGKRLLLAQHDPMITGPHQRYGYVLAYSQAKAGQGRAPPASYRTGQSPIRIRTLARGDFSITADRETNGLTLINKLGDRRTIPTCAGPQALLIAPDEKRLIVTCAPASGSAKGRLVSYRSDFQARPWPAIAEEAAQDVSGSFVSGSFSPSGDRVYMADKTHARLVELEPQTLRQLREFSTGDVPLDVVVLEVREAERDRLAREESRARSRLTAILTEMKARSRPLVDLGWTEIVQPAPAEPGARPEPEQIRRVKHAFRAPNSLRSEAEDGSVRLAQAGHSITIGRDGRFWVGPRQDLTTALLSLWSLPVDQAIRELAGDVPGSPYLRSGLAVDLIGEVREPSGRYLLIGTLQPKTRVSQLWIDAERRRATNLAEGFPSFAVSGHGSASSGGMVETKFYDFVTTASGAELATRVERVVEGRRIQTARIEALTENSGLAAIQFDLARLGGLAARAAITPAPAPSTADVDTSSPGQPVPIISAGYLSRPGEPHAGYSSNPPTSGPRLHQLADFGPHELPVPPEIQVHNLEHGGVLLQYNCPDGCPTLAAKLEQIAKDRPFVLTAPYPVMSARIALTAWGRIETMGELDLTRVHRFIDAYAGKDHHSRENGSLSVLEH